MSDPVTNVEIEDVLSSIRRLVSNGDTSRANASEDGGTSQINEGVGDEDAAQHHVPEGSAADRGWFDAPDQNSQPAQDDTAVSTQAEATAPDDKPEKFVLTPAFLVVDEGQQPADEDHEDHAVDWAVDPDENADLVQDHEQNDDWTDMSEDQVATGKTEVDDTPPDVAPLELTNRIVEEPPQSVEASDGEAGEDTPVEAGVTADVPDRSALVAQIAELEAAVSNEAQEFEPDGSEIVAQTIAWPGTIVRQLSEDTPEAETIEAGETGHQGSDAAAVAPDREGAADEAAQFTHRDPAAARVDVRVDDAGDYDDELDDDLDEIMAGNGTIDEEALRALVSEVVREELTGPMGERITRNVRKLVRREIYRILNSQEFD
ncbi:hypothetical protein [Pseudooctadecabacter jejudonensis]|uniref:Uncharacterized protein n=1 Tax=Pseudooctadecabacter jejudonensis TaxID=1391910 RepID=A0A1Y5RVY8_9RHOB|nr:hypothetical protein [Pseudooctadecabacter jejudonensis]SLN23814.1 hypothetical protein PSJ8397_01022 [Pseudooctadecabacter jejudonensis]